MAKDASSEAPLLARDAGGTWAANVLGMGLGYLSMLFATHALGASRFGALTLGVTLAAFGAALSALGLAPGVLPFLSRARRDDDEVGIRNVIRASLGLTLTASLVVGSALYLAAPWLGRVLFADADFFRILRPLSLLVVFGALSSVALMLLQGFMAIIQRAWIERVLAIGITGLVMGLTWMADWGLPGALTAVIAGPLMGLLAGVALLSGRAPGAFSPVGGLRSLPVSRLLGYSWPLLGTSLFTFLLTWSDILLLGHLRDAEEVGIYGVSARLVLAVTVIHESLRPVFQSRLSDLYVRDDWPGIRRLFRLTARWSLWPALVVGGVLILWSSQLLTLFGPEFTGTAWVLITLCLAKLTVATTGMSGLVFGITGKTRLNLFNLILLFTGNIALNLLLIPRHGALGAALATGISVASIRALQLVQLGYCYRMFSWDLSSLVPLLGVPALAVLVYPFRTGPGGSAGWLLPLILFILACVVLFAAMGIKDEERAVLSMIKRTMGSGKSR